MEQNFISISHHSHKIHKMELGLKTGDVLLCNYTGGGPLGWFASAIKRFTESEFSHCAVVLKNPTFLPLPNGLYVWESSYDGKPDPQDDRVKLGVKVTPYAEFHKEYTTNSQLFVKKLYTEQEITQEALKDIHTVVYNKPYDIVPKDWYQAYKREDSSPQKTSRFWCSAFVGYVYTKLGFYPPSTDWSMLRPSDIAENRIPLTNAFLGTLTEIK